MKKFERVLLYVCFSVIALFVFIAAAPFGHNIQFQPSWTHFYVLDASGNVVAHWRQSDKSARAYGRLDVDGPLVANDVLHVTGAIDAPSAVLGGGSAAPDAELTINGESVFNGNDATHISADGTATGGIKFASGETGVNPEMHLFNYDSATGGLMIGGYFTDYAFKSSDVGSNLLLQKESNKINFYYDSGITPGADITWNTGAYMSLTNGNWWFAGNGSFDSVTQRSLRKFKCLITTLDDKPVAENPVRGDPQPIKFNMSPEYYRPQKSDFVKNATGDASYLRSLKSWEKSKAQLRYTKRRQGLDADTMPEEWILGDGYLVDAVLADLYDRSYKKDKIIEALEQRVAALEGK